MTVGRRRAIAVTLSAALAACAPGAGESGSPPAESARSGTAPAASRMQAGLFSGYRPTSPHWPHIRTQVSDYRIQYQADAARRDTEYRWAAAHFDHIVLDNGDSLSVPEYRKLNPAARLYRYALNWTLIRPGEEKTEDNSNSYYGHMEEWYRRHPQYRLEDAFLHDAGACPTGSAVASCRIAIRIWTQNRWCINPGDAGLRAYQRERLSEVARDVDGLFLDEHGSGDIADRLRPKRLREYPSWERYEADLVSLLAEERKALGQGKILLVNTSAYTTPWDLRMAEAGGASHGELLNDAFRPGIEETWRFVETVLERGGSMNLSPADSMPSGFPRGNEASPRARKLMWELASYYMVVPDRPDRLALNLSPKWDQPYETRWLRALEANVGRPSAKRERFTPADDAGPSVLWRREFERALIVLRPAEGRGVQKPYSQTVDVPLPAGERYLPLRADGSLGDAVTNISLRASEAAVLIKATSIGR